MHHCTRILRSKSLSVQMLAGLVSTASLLGVAANVPVAYARVITVPDDFSQQKKPDGKYTELDMIMFFFHQAHCQLKRREKQT